jgi:hypothetical protein
MTSLTSGRFQPALILPEGDTIDFTFRWSNNGTLFTPAVTPVWIFGIKDATTPSGDFLVQVNTASANAGVYTFTVPISSAELQTWLSTATSQSFVAIQITDTANGIATTPLLCQIAANQNDSGTTPTSANGTLNVAAGKTVTFPLSLTFPASAGTSGYKLTTDGAGALTWTADAGLTTLTVGTTTITSGTTTRILYDNAGVLGEYAISGTGSVAMTAGPSFTGDVSFMGANTVTMPSGTLSIGEHDIVSNGTGASTLYIPDGNTYIPSISQPVTFTGLSAARSYALPDASGLGTVAVATASATNTHALFATATSGAPQYRAIAHADLPQAINYTPAAILKRGNTAPPTLSSTGILIPAVAVADGSEQTFYIPLNAAIWAGKSVTLSVQIASANTGTATGNWCYSLRLAYKTTALDGLTTTDCTSTSAPGATMLGTANETTAASGGTGAGYSYSKVISSAALSVPSNVTVLVLEFIAARNNVLDTNGDAYQIQNFTVSG